MLSSVATVRRELEQSTIRQCDLIPTITINAGIRGPTQPIAAVAALTDKIERFKTALPLGCAVGGGGAAEERAEA